MTNAKERSRTRTHDNPFQPRVAHFTLAFHNLQLSLSMDNKRVGKKTKETVCGRDAQISWFPQSP